MKVALLDASPYLVDEMDLGSKNRISHVANLRSVDVRGNTAGQIITTRCVFLCIRSLYRVNLTRVVDS